MLIIFYSIISLIKNVEVKTSLKLNKEETFWKDDSTWNQNVSSLMILGKPNGGN
jgi:hypothetical protein